MTIHAQCPRLAVLASTVALLAACGFDAPKSAHITVTSGDGQHGVVGTPLADPLVVTVVDADDAPIENFSVDFAVVAGGGALGTMTERTDVQGRTQTTLTLGITAGVQVVEARAVGVDAGAFTLVGLADAPNTIAIGASPIAGAVGSQLADPLVAIVTDKYANPIADLPIEFVVTSGGGSVSNVTATTDATGSGSTLLTLGTVVGDNVIEARASNLTSAEFHVLATTTQAAEIALVTGNAQSGTVGEALPTPLAVRVRDQFANPIAGVNVSFTVSLGTGSLSVASAPTGADGKAQATLTPGNLAGENRVTALVAGVATPVVFTETGIPGPPTSIAIVSGNTNQSAIVHTPLAAPFVIELRDRYSNLTPNVAVQFVATTGGGTLSPPNPLTNAQGRAQAVLTVGDSVGANMVEARVQGIPGIAAVFTATGMVGPASQLIKVLGDGWSSPGSPAWCDSNPFPITVLLADMYGNAIPGQVVTFSPSSVTLTQTSATTDSNGRAGTNVQIDRVACDTNGSNPTTFTVKATGAGLTTTFVWQGD